MTKLLNEINDIRLEREKAILDATELICKLMDQQCISRFTLAKHIGKTGGHINRILDGSSELTIRMFSDILVALGYTVRFEADKRSN